MLSIKREILVINIEGDGEGVEQTRKRRGINILIVAGELARHAVDDTYHSDGEGRVGGCFRRIDALGVSKEKAQKDDQKRKRAH